MFSVSYRDSRPIYEQIKEQAIKLIMTGVLKPGDKLQSVRELAAELVINPNTIQRAYRELESDGYIHTVPGKGCFVAEEVKTDERRLAGLLDEFNACAAKLIFGGVTAEELVDRINKLNDEIKRGKLC